MDYEKAYKEALERARMINNGEDVDVEAGTTTCEYIFPELAESEDEKIRKMLIDSFTRADMGGEIYGKGVTYKQVIAWLEKQGEQKPYGQRQECIDCQFNYAGECKGSCAMKRSEQKPTDKVEPKFKVGDWVANDYCVGKVIALTDDAYLLDSGQGIPFSCEHNIHLWTIQDAKDGDVLIDKSNGRECPFIFKETKSSDIKTDCLNPLTVLGYCGIGGAGFTKGSGWGDTANCIYYPATKEQRDALMRAMTDAGYTFDFEKKELKKLKFRVGDEVITENEESLTITRIDEEGYWSNDLFICDFDSERIWNLVEQYPTEWSEEDEKNWRRAIRATQVVYPEAADWLKFLKDKYIWKPSNEQMEVLLSEVNGWKKGCPKQIVLESLYNDLKKLK